MNIDTARHVVRQPFQIARELQGLLPFLKERCDATEYQEYAVDIAKAVDSVEIESRISTYGRYF